MVMNVALSWIITFQIAKMLETFDTLRVLGSFMNPRSDNLQTLYQIQWREYLNFMRPYTWYVYMLDRVH